jgi:hypothetical protein
MTDETTELQGMRFEFAWDYFDFHAKQRITMFNFFILLLPFLFGGVFYNLKVDAGLSHPFIAMVIAAAGATVSMTFLLFDIRSRRLIHLSQTNLKLMEEQYLYKENELPLICEGRQFLGIMREEDKQHKNHFIKFSKLITCFYLGSGIVFVGFAIYSLMLREGIRVPF